MNTLPLRITVPKDEDTLSVGCRLIMRNRVDSISSILNALGLKSISALGASAPISAIRNLSMATGCNFEILYNNSLISKNGSVWLGEQKISDTGFAPNILKATRVCPICLSEDLKRTEDVVTCRPYRRIAWRFRYLRACLRHGTLLLSKCPNCERALAQSSLNVRYCSCGFDLATATPTALSEQILVPERYLFSRSFEKCSEPHWLLETIAPAEAELALSQFGDVVAIGHKKRYFSQLSAIEQLTTIERGFSILSSPAALDEFFDIQLEEATYKRAGPCPIYGSLYHWLYNADPVTFEPIKDAIAQHFAKTQSVFRSTRVFRRKVSPQRAITARDAANECGCSLTTLRSLLEMIEKRPIGMVQNSDELDLGRVAELKKMFNSIICSVEARKTLSLTEGVMMQFVNSLYFGVNNRRRFARRFINRSMYEKLLNLFSPEQKVYAECPEGFTHIYRAALRFRVSVPDIAWRVIEGEVASAGVVAGKRGLASVLVCVQSVKNIVGRRKKQKQA